MHLPALLFSLLVLAGGEDYDPSRLVGSEPVTLSRHVEAGFRAYRALAHPSYFAISIDGRAYGYSYCPDGACDGDARTVALRSCEQGSPGVPCQLYARGQAVIWGSADS